LRMLAGETPPDTGTVRQAEQLRVVTFDQHRDQLDLNLTLRQSLCEKGDYVFYRERPIHVASWAARFLFEKDQLDRPLGRFSGGEQSRVLIARLMIRPADLLLLDEPTNDLDIPSLEVLEQSLAEFAGALVLVTHDRYLLDRVSRQILALDGKGHAEFFADLSQWEDHRENQKMRERRKGVSPPVKGDIAPPKPRKSWSSKEQKELDGMEAAIHDAEKKLKEAQEKLEDPWVVRDAVKLQELQKGVDAEKTALEKLFKRWEELEAKKN
jgi:ABC transport system ATP-binding/permease protein